MSDHQQEPAPNVARQDDVLIFRVGCTWCACHTNLVHAIHRVQPDRRITLSESEQIIVLRDAPPVPLHQRPESFGKSLDAPPCAQRWVIFHHNNTHQCAQIDEVVGIAPIELDANQQPILRVRDAQGSSHTLELRMDMPDALLEHAA